MLTRMALAFLRHIETLGALQDAIGVRHQSVMPASMTRPGYRELDFHGQATARSASLPARSSRMSRCMSRWNRVTPVSCTVGIGIRLGSSAKIGSGSCGERVGQEGKIWGGGETIK